MAGETEKTVLKKQPSLTRSLSSLSPRSRPLWLKREESSSDRVSNEYMISDVSGWGFVLDHGQKCWVNRWLLIRNNVLYIDQSPLLLQPDAVSLTKCSIKTPNLAERIVALSTMPTRAVLSTEAPPQHHSGHLIEVQAPGSTLPLTLLFWTPYEFRQWLFWLNMAAKRPAELCSDLTTERETLYKLLRQLDQTAKSVEAMKVKLTKALDRTYTATSPTSSGHRAIKIWVFTWNVGAKDITEKHREELRRIIPGGYDIYILGLQEAITDEIYNEVRSHLLQRYRVERMAFSADPYVRGRGDGSFLSQKFTGIAVFSAIALAPHVKILRESAQSLGVNQGSKGAAVVCLKIFDTTMALLSCHLSAKGASDRLKGYQMLIEQAGNALGDQYLQLLEQFHHIIFLGDLNYRVEAPVEQVTELIVKGDMDKLRQYDQLGAEMKRCAAFYRFREPVPAPNFLPTYKKREDRPPSPDYSNPNWVNQVYRTQFKEAFYKGGQTKARIPSFTDRILYHSLSDKMGDLLPELLSTSDGNESEDDEPIQQREAARFRRRGLGDKGPHVYKSVNDLLALSDHSPVFAGFVLRIPPPTKPVSPKGNAPSRGPASPRAMERRGSFGTTGGGGAPSAPLVAAAREISVFCVKLQTVHLLTLTAIKNDNDEHSLHDCSYNGSLLGDIEGGDFESRLQADSADRFQKLITEKKYNIQASQPKYVRVLFPAPFEDTRNPVQSVLIQSEQLALTNADNFPTLFAQPSATAPDMHFVIKAHGMGVGGEQVGQCVVRLSKKQFSKPTTLRFNEPLTRGGLPTKLRLQFSLFLFTTADYKDAV